VKEDEISHWKRNFLTLKVLLSLGRKFYHGENPSSLKELSDEIQTPVILIESLLRPLIEKGVVIEVQEGERVYLLGRKLDSLQVREAIECFREGLERPLISMGDREGEYVWQLMEKGDNAFNQELGNLTLREVIEGFEKIDGMKDIQ
jgi:DNA-binding IscR family transcriptional regulator